MAARPGQNDDPTGQRTSHIASSERRSPFIDGLLRGSVLAPGIATAASAAAWTARAPSRLWIGAAGFADAYRREPVRPGTPFDLASVTKPITAIALARAVRAGRARYDDGLGRWLSEARNTASEHVPLELLLAHRAGLHAHLELFSPLRRGEAVDVAASLRRAAGARRPGCTGAPPSAGFPPLYSDLGYLLLGAALERMCERPLDELLQESLAAVGSRVSSARQLTEPAVVTEVVPWRGGPVRSEVHDENARAVAGHGSAGHAGLFATAADVARFGAAVLIAQRGELRAWLEPDELEPLLRPRAGGSLLAGFDGKSAYGSSAGERFSASSFGHLGFTGTSLWCDPQAGVAVALLTNRVYPTRENIAIRAARPALHGELHRFATRVPVPAGG